VSHYRRASLFLLPFHRLLTLTEAHTSRQPSKAHVGMSGGKTCGKQAAQYAGKQPNEGSVVTSRDTTAPENEVHSSGHTPRESMCLKEMYAFKQAGAQGKTEKGKQSVRLSRRRGRAPRSKLRRRNQRFSPLTALPQLWKPWCRTWTADRTIMINHDRPASCPSPVPLGNRRSCTSDRTITTGAGLGQLAGRSC
jgi:hypothetical protein